MFLKNISEVQTFANEHQDFIARWQREWQLIFESYADRIIENIDKQYLKDLETTFSELEGKFKMIFIASLLCMLRIQILLQTKMRQYIDS